MQKECIRISEEIHKKILPLCPKKWWKHGMPQEFLLKLLLLFLLHSSCTFYCIEIFSKINSNLIKHRKTCITCLSIFLQPAPFFCTTLTSTESEFAKTDSRIFWPSWSSKTKPNPCKPFKVLYKYATNINAIILIICHYVTIALGLPTFNPNAQTTSRKNPSKMNRFELPFMITNRS